MVLAALPRGRCETGEAVLTIYTGPNWEVREGKWQDSPLETCDHVISDPPYDERTHRNGMHGTGTGRDGQIAVSVDKGFVHLTDPGALALQLLAISKRWVVCFCTIEMIGDYARGAGADWVRGGIWDKLDPVPQFSGDRPGVFGDAIAIMHRRGKKRWNGHGRAARWRCATEAHFSAKEMRVHTTQKPIDLMLALVSDFTDPGDLVWDPYCGSGTTGVACLRLGRRFVGHEMQPHYAKIAAERLAAEDRGLTLADVRRGQTSILDRLTP